MKVFEWIKRLFRGPAAPPEKPGQREGRPVSAVVRRPARLSDLLQIAEPRRTSNHSRDWPALSLTWLLRRSCGPSEEALDPLEDLHGSLRLRDTFTARPTQLQRRPHRRTDGRTACSRSASAAARSVSRAERDWFPGL